jgi:hypothetical protein
MSIPTRRGLALGLLAPLVALLAVGCADHAPPLDPEAAHPLAAAGGPHVVHVAPPTGDVDIDRASIIAALEAVQPGGTVQFAPGTYVIGIEGLFEWIRVTVPRVTLQGHPDGTTLQGCHPDGDPVFLGGCVGLQLVGGRQTVRDLTFEYFNQPLIVGFFLFREAAQHQIGGYRIENNTFRNSMWGVRMFGQWSQLTVVRHNTFLNVASAVQMFGRTAHVIDNHISAPDPGQIPHFFLAELGIDLFTRDDLQTGPCDDNLVARNHIEGFSFGIGMWGLSAAGCRHNTIRGNTLVDIMEVDDYEWPGAAIWMENWTADSELFASTLIEGNHIDGVQGQGMYAYRGSRIRVVNNTIHDVVRSQYTVGYLGESNGAGTWLSPESTENRIQANLFAGNEAGDVVLEGDYNHVATRSASDVVRDLGIGNRVTGPGSVVTTAAPAASTAGAPATAERAGAPGMLRERFGARGRMLEEGMRVAPH